MALAEEMAYAAQEALGTTTITRAGCEIDLKPPRRRVAARRDSRRHRINMPTILTRRLQRRSRRSATPESR